MAGVNRVFIIGHLGKDPEVSALPNGKSAVRFSVATSESWKDASGVKQERTEWHNVTFFDRMADVCALYLKKGAKVFIGGSLRTDKYTDKQGIERYVTKIMGKEMQMLDSKPKESEEVAIAQTDNFYNDDVPF